MGQNRGLSVCLIIAMSTLLAGADTSPSPIPQQLGDLVSSEPTVRSKARSLLREQRLAVTNTLCDTLKSDFEKPDMAYNGRLNMLISTSAEWRVEEAVSLLVSHIDFRLDGNTFPPGMRMADIAFFPAASALARISGPIVVKAILSRLETETNEDNLRLCAFVLNESWGGRQEFSAVMLDYYVKGTILAKNEVALAKVVEILKDKNSQILPHR